MSNRVYHTVLRVNKKDSAFLYFQLEANENLCFYSTLQESMGQTYRDISIKSDPSTKEEVIRLLNHLKTKMEIEVLVEEDIH